MNWAYWNPVRIRFGAGLLDEVAGLIGNRRWALVTYDQRTIAPLVMQWATEGRDHAGGVFIDDKSIAQADVGGKVRALLTLWDKAHEQDWKNAISYLQPDRS